MSYRSVLGWSSSIPQARFPFRVIVRLSGLILVGLMVLTGVPAGAQTPAPDTAVDRMDTFAKPRLDVAAARRVGPLRLGLGLLELSMQSGWIVPAEPVGGQVREFVFLGEARVQLDPPNEVERQQLELFTGADRLNESIQEAVLVIGPDVAAAALEKLPKATDFSEELSQRAQARFSQWSTSAERGVLGVELALVGDLLQDPLYQGYFAAWFESDSIGDFVYLNEPRSYEQFQLGQFVPLDATEKEKRKLSKQVRKQQRRGRFLGVEVEELGQFDAWVMASNSDAEGQPVRGGSCFRNTHYSIDLEILPETLDLRGQVTIDTEAKIDGCRVIRWNLNRDLVVSSVKFLSGETLEYRQEGYELVVVFPSPPPAGETVPLLVQYQGALIEEFKSSRVLSDTQSWFPNSLLADWATFEARFSWPKRYDLVASGVEVARGEEKETRWLAKKLDQPAQLFTFDMGRFKSVEKQVDGVRVRVAADGLSREILTASTSRSIESDSEEILTAAEDALRYFSEIFGEYPLSELTLVTTPRLFSQASPGLVTLSPLMVSEYSKLLGAEDPRSVVAHEIAHMWWGHVIGFASYRDAWISEALANYSSLLFARNKLGQHRLGPTRGWQDELTDTLEDGRTIESIGPMVLGHRLESSLASGAYSAIVYTKGAVVLDMLARSYGEENFIKVLGSLLAGVRFQSLSTEDFLALVERVTGSELDAFSEQFIFGTGLPEIHYTYQVEKQGPSYKVTGEARQVSPYRYTYAAEDRGGKLVVGRTAATAIDVSQSRLVVPVQVAVFDPSHKNDRAKEPRVRGNRVQEFQAMLSGQTTPIELVLDHEPKQVWLDAGEHVFGRFFNGNRSPKRVAYYEGLELVAERRFDDAEVSFAKALRAAAEVGPSFAEERTEREIQDLGYQLDFRIYRSLAYSFLDQGKVASADRAWQSARDVAKMAKREKAWTKDFSSKVLEANLALDKGDHERAFDLISRPILKNKWGSPRGELVLAIAAQALGKREEVEEVLERASQRGSDVSLLRK